MHPARTAKLPFHEPNDIPGCADAPGKKANQSSTTQINFTSQIIADHRFSSQQQVRAHPLRLHRQNRPPSPAVGDNELSATPQAILSQHCTATLQAQALAPASSSGGLKQLQMWSHLTFGCSSHLNSQPWSHLNSHGTFENNGRSLYKAATMNLTCSHLLGFSSSIQLFSQLLVSTMSNLLKVMGNATRL